MVPYADLFYVPQLEHGFQVKLPNGHDWTPDCQANNCTIPDDFRQERHHCWIVKYMEGHNDLPYVTANKDGVTCAAGAGSILSGDYHGFLTNGELT